MIRRQNRFHGHHAVSRVRGQSVHGRYFSLRMSSSQNNEQAYRLAVVVSKKIANSAVVRNRIRRRAYEIVRTKLSLEDRSLDMVLYAKSAEVAFVDSDMLTKDILSLFHRAEKNLNSRPPKYRS